MHDRRGRHRDQRTGGSSRTQDSTDEDHPVDELRGKIEVFVRPLPEAGTSLRQVSVNGGTEPVWAHSGRELFYVNGANELVTVQVSTDPALSSGRLRRPPLVSRRASGSIESTTDARLEPTVLSCASGTRRVLAARAR